MEGYSPQDTARDVGTPLHVLLRETVHPAGSPAARLVETLWTMGTSVEEVLAAAWRVLHLDPPADSRLAGGGVTVKRKLRVVLWLLGHPCVGLTPATQALKNIRKTEAIAYLCSVSHDHGIGIKSPSARLLALSYQSYVNSPPRACCRIHHGRYINIGDRTSR
jgi:hypothetical protein